MEDKSVQIGPFLSLFSVRRQRLSINISSIHLLLLVVLSMLVLSRLGMSLFLVTPIFVWITYRAMTELQTSYQFKLDWTIDDDLTQAVHQDLWSE